jgi:PhnB protein
MPQVKPMSTVKPIPDGHHSVQPYLIFKNCGQAIAFYVKAFGATEKFRMASPGGGTGHAEIQIGDSIIMMADESPQMGAFSTEHFGGSPVSLLIYTEDCDAVYARALAAGANSLREPADQPYGDRMSGVKDPFGYRWWIATHIKDVSPQEMAAQS